MPERPVRIAIVNDYAIVVEGLAAVLQPFSDRVEVVELDTGGARVEQEVDVVLYDSFGQPQGTAIEVADLLSRSGDARLVVFGWNTEPRVVQESLQAGASGYLSKGLEGKELVDALERIADGEVVVPQSEDEGDDTFGRWPGDREGLTAREAEVLALICQGLSNQEICERAYLGLNTVKTYIRSLYRKIDVDSRTQAVLWGIDHGFGRDGMRRDTDPS